MSARHDQAVATLARLGLAADDVQADRLDEAQLRVLAGGADGAGVVAALGEVGGAATAALLARLETDVPDRALRKALRRALYRLGQRGIAVPAPAPVAPPPRTATPDIDGFVSAFDGRGDRLVWLSRPQGDGETLLLTAGVNEPGGLLEVHVGEVTRKEMRATRERLQTETGVRFVRAPWPVLDALLVEAHERTGAPDRRRDYLRVRPRFTTASPQPPAEPVSPRASAPRGDEADALVAASVALLEVPEIRGWWPAAEALVPFAAEMDAVQDSPIVLSRVQQEERLRAIVARAAEALYPPQAFIRRLEGTAYVLAESGRVPAARQALAVAAALRVRPGAIADVPVVGVLVQHALATALSDRTSHREEERRSSLVLTPAEAVRARSPGRPGPARG